MKATQQHVNSQPGRNGKVTVELDNEDGTVSIFETLGHFPSGLRVSMEAQVEDGRTIRPISDQTDVAISNPDGIQFIDISISGRAFGGSQGQILRMYLKNKVPEGMEDY